MLAHDFKIAVILGDSISKDFVSEGLPVLSAVEERFEMSFACSRAWFHLLYV